MSNKLELPDSFSTIVTEKDKKYLISLLLTLSIYHKQTSIYILTTESVKKSIDQLTPNLYDKLDNLCGKYKLRKWVGVKIIYDFDYPDEEY